MFSLSAIMSNGNIVFIVITFFIALVAIYVLYSIIMYQGNGKGKGSELQLSTKKVLEQVKILYDTEEYALVELLATKYLERVPSHQDVRQYLARAYFKSKKFNNAIRQCLIILKKNPDDVETRQLLGDCYIQKQLLGKAIKEYETIFDYKSKDKDVLRTLAKLYRDTEQTYSAISVYNLIVELVDSNSEMAELQSIIADLNEEVRDYPAAFEAYKTLLDIYPTDIVTNQRLIELYIKLKNQPKAIETLLFMAGFVNDPKVMLWIYEHLVDLYVETEEFEKAIEYSNKLLEVPGSDKFKVQNDIATFNLKLNNTDTGIAILEDLVMMSQSGFDVTVELANAYIGQNNFEKALEKYLALLDKATQKEAKTARTLVCDLYIKWSEFCAAQGNYEESYKHLTSATEYNPLNPEIYYHKALNNIAQKNYTASIDLIQQALDYDKFNDNHAKYFLALADAHHNLGNFFEEKKALSDLLKLDPENAQGLYRSGLMYVAQHDTKSAEETFKKALENDPNLIPAKYNLALLYESNNRDKARDLYMDILEQDPQNEEAKNALAELSSSDY